MFWLATYCNTGVCFLSFVVAVVVVLQFIGWILFTLGYCFLFSSRWHFKHRFVWSAAHSRWRGLQRRYVGYVRSLARVGAQVLIECACYSVLSLSSHSDLTSPLAEINSTFSRQGLQVLPSLFVSSCLSSFSIFRHASCFLWVEIGTFFLWKNPKWWESWRFTLIFFQCRNHDSKRYFLRGTWQLGKGAW